MKQIETPRFCIQLRAILVYSFEFKMKKISKKFSLISQNFYFGLSRLHS